MTAWELIERRRRRFVLRYNARFRKALRKQIEPVLEAISPTFIEQFETMVPILITGEALKEPFYDLYRETGLAFRNSLKISLKAKGLKYDTKSLEDELWMEDMKAYAELVMGERITMMNETTKKAILYLMRESIKEGSDPGWAIDKFATKIRNDLMEKYGTYEKWRARRIAQTEVLSASNYSSHRSATDSGVPLRKRWLTAPFGLSKVERHNFVSGLTEQRPMMSEPFIVDNVRMMHPGDPAGGAEHVINCKCAIGYETL